MIQVIYHNLPRSHRMFLMQKKRFAALREDPQVKSEKAHPLGEVHGDAKRGTSAILIEKLVKKLG